MSAVSLSRLHLGDLQAVVCPHRLRLATLQAAAMAVLVRPLRRGMGPT